MNKELLEHIGMNDNEVAVYTTLLQNGVMSVLQISQATKLKRANLYNVLEHLASRGAVEKVMRGKSACFQSTDPDNLLTMAEKQEEEARHHRETLELVLPSFKSLYQKVSEKPSVHTFEGLSGIKRIYDDIIKTKQDILLIRSVYDNDLPALDTIVHRQIGRQVEAGIHSRIIAPYVSNTREKVMNKDKENLVKRRIVSLKSFHLPAQVIIYANKIALTDLKGKSYISTLIENESITETFRIIFHLIWELTKDEDKLFRARMRDV